MRNVAIFGGTFNPVHSGHLLIASIALEQAALDQVIWVPAYQPPHKTSPLPDFEHRLEMVRLAIADQVKFTVSDIEAQRAGVSYAIATFTDLQSFYPNANWYWIIGSDAFQTLPKWRGSSILARECTWLVAPRQVTRTDEDDETVMENADLLSGRSEPDITQSSPQYQVRDCCQIVFESSECHSMRLRYSRLPMSPINISSSLVRTASRAGRNLSPFVPDLVSRYIAKHKLYAK